MHNRDYNIAYIIIHFIMLHNSYNPILVLTCIYMLECADFSCDELSALGIGFEK